MADIELVIKLDEEYVKQIDRLRLSGGIEDRSLQINVINAIKNGTPQPKMGHWIDDGQYAEGHSEHACRCSKCGYTYIGYTDKYKECPNCGAKMQEVEE